MIKVLICDDEAPALELLGSMLEATGLVDIVARCQSAQAAAEAIASGGVELAILDVEMPDMSGVSVIQSMAVEPRPLLIFATAHPEYALEAFEVDAIDYLLKPLTMERVHKAVEKAVRMHQLIQATERENVGTAVVPVPNTRTIPVKHAGQVFLVPFENVVWIEAAGDYSLIHTPDREYALRRTIKALEDILPSAQFARVHRSTIIAINHVMKIELLPKGEAMITLSNGAMVRASRTYRDVVQVLTRL